MGRFDKEPSQVAVTADVNPALVALLERLEAGQRSTDSAVARLVKTVSGLASQVGQIDVRPMVNVSPTPPADVKVDLSSDLAQIIEQIKQIPAPVVHVERDASAPPTTVDLAPLHDQQEAVRLLLEQMRDRISDALSGTRSHFDGRIRDANGQVNFPQVVGTYGYAAGTTGTPTIPANARILSITATGPALSGTATVTIDGGDTITIPADTTWVANPEANLTAPTLVFTSTRAYFVDWVV